MIERSQFERLYALDHIPSYPLVWKSVNNMITGADIGNQGVLEYIAGLVSYDPALTMELLKIANSEVFGFNRKVSSPLDALLVLNNDLIKLIFSQHPVIPGLVKYDEEIRKEIRLLIKHSVEVNLCADEIVRIIMQKEREKKIVRDEILAAATIHDIGLYYLAVYQPRDYVAWIKSVRESGLDMRKKKKEIHNLPDHSLLGSILCDIWNFPLSIVKSVAVHHSPWTGSGEWGIESDILYLADSFSPSYYRLYYDEDVYTVYEHIAMKTRITETMENLGIDFTDVPGIINNVLQKSLLVFDELGIGESREGSD